MDELPELLLSHYEDPYHRGQCDRATHCSQSHDPNSQHFILMQLRISDEGVVEEVWFDSQGCVYCEAPASILAQYCEAKSIDELSEFDSASYLALTQLDQVSAPSSCHMLAWTAIQNALRSTDIEYEGGHPMFGGPSLGEES
jgi:nitrogen fixation NifU-like protein